MRRETTTDDEQGRGLALIDGLIDLNSGTRGIVDDADGPGKIVYVVLSLDPLFSRGPDNALHTRHFNGSTWSGWTGLGGSLASGPAAAVPQIQTGSTTWVPWGTEVIAVGPDQHLWADLKPVGGSWTGWHFLYPQAAP